jgi:ribosome-associated translation inhibitor RaiA
LSFEKLSNEAIVAAALEVAKEQNEQVTPPRISYSINFFAHGDKSDPHNLEAADYKRGTAKWEYMEGRIRSALERVQDRVHSVDVRLTVEGHKPKTYRMEATVTLLHHLAKYMKNKEKAVVVVSKSSHAQGSFTEAVDHMHDTLKRNLRKEKEKRASKLKHARKDAVKDDIRVADTQDGEISEIPNPNVID